MKLSVNGEPVEVDGSLTVQDLLERYNLKAARVAVEVDRQIVAKADYGSTRLGDGQQVEIVQFVGGG